MIKCQHCGRQIPYDANLCPYCGRSIKQFQQKEVLDELEDQEHAEIPSGNDTPIQRPKPPKDSKLLFFIIAVLLLLLIVGAIYHYTSLNSEKMVDEQEPADSVSAQVTDSVKKSAAPVSFNPKKKQQVVVNGEGVRLRFGPSLKAGYLKDEKGATRSVKKGTKLECVGETGDWYQVVYLGKRYYMSKQFSYLVE